MKRLLLTAVVGLALASAANAADLAVKTPLFKAPPITLYSWSGFYVGLNAGAAVDPAHAQTSVVGTGYFSTADLSTIASAGNRTFDTPGFTGGIQAGYNWQMNSAVLGVETDFDYMGVKGSTSNSTPYPAGGSFTINQSVNTDWLFTLRPRLGWAWNHWLFYATGGLAVTQIKADFLFTDNFAAHESAGIDKTQAGWALGGGVEYAMQGPWSIKVEYLHVDFGKVSTTSNNLTTTVGVPNHIFTHSAALSDDIVRAGINYRF